MNRKGVMYTIVAVMLLLAIAGLFFAQNRRSGHEVHKSVEERVKSVNTFIRSLERDSERAAYIAGFRTLIAMEQHVTTTGEYVSDPHGVFKEIFLTGNYSGTDFVIMENSSFGEYLIRVSLESGLQGIHFNATVVNVTLWQTDAWNIRVNYTMEMNVTDGRGTATWRTTRNFTGFVPIVDIRDPVFSVGTLSRVQRVIKRTNVTYFVDDENNKNDTTGLMLHFNTSGYEAFGRGPNILMRFAGNLTDNEFGIESLVDTAEISDQGLIVNTTASIVDWEYFSGVDADACNVQNLLTKMKFDTSDLELYEIEGNLTYASC